MNPHNASNGKVKEKAFYSIGYYTSIGHTISLLFKQPQFFFGIKT